MTATLTSPPLLPAALVGQAEAALAELEQTEPRNVYAGRRGLVAAVPGRDNSSTVFRRAGALVRVEVWHYMPSQWSERYTLPPELERRAAAVLDR